MEQDNSKVAWGKALKPIFALLLVIVLWQVLVLEMLKNGIISTLIADWVCYVFGRSGKGIFHFPRAVRIAET